MQGFTQVDNDIFDVLMAELSHAEFKVYMALYRKIAGWNKESDTIGIGQVSELTGVSKRKVSDVYASLSKMGLIECEKSYNNMHKITLKPCSEFITQDETSHALSSTSHAANSSSHALSSTSHAVSAYTKETKQNKLNKINITKDSEVSEQPKKPKPPKPKKILHELPKDFEYSQTHIDKCNDYGMKIDFVFDTFKNHHAAKGSKFKDWSAAFHNWLNNQIKWGKLTKIQRPSQTETPTKYGFTDEERKEGKAHIKKLLEELAA